MCFSAAASFTASTLLLICGFSAITCARKQYNRIAMIPFLFSIQQFFEGITWIQLTRGNSTPHVAPMGFLIFAYIVWPFWIPWSIHPLIQSNMQKLILTISYCAATIFICMALISSGLQKITATIAYCHIYYPFLIPEWAIFSGNICYLVATILPFFIIRNLQLWFMGILLILSYLITFYFYLYNFTSVWCFFAAIISAYTIIIVRKS